MEMKELWRWRIDRDGAIMKLTELFKCRVYGRRNVVVGNEFLYTQAY